LFGYTSNDPINWIDKDGKIAGLICVGIIAITAELFIVSIIEAGQRIEMQQLENEIQSRQGLPIDYGRPLRDMEHNAENILGPIAIMPGTKPLFPGKVAPLKPTRTRWDDIVDALVEAFSAD